MRAVALVARRRGGALLAARAASHAGAAALARRAPLQLGARAQSTASTGSTPALPLAGVDAVTVVYGSQTGTAQAFAMQLGQAIGDELPAAAVDVKDVYELSGADFAALAARPGHLTVLVAACFGRGEPTDSMKKLWAWINEPARDADAGGRLLGGGRFAVFGLGSSQTHKEYYNVIGRRMDARLEALGGTRAYPRGEGDASGCIDLDWEAWQGGLVAALKNGGAPPAEAAAAAPAAAPASTTGGAGAACDSLLPPQQAPPKPLYAPGRLANPYHTESDAPQPLRVVPAAAPCDLPSAKTAAAPPTAADNDEEAVAAAVAAAGGLARTSVSGLSNLTPREVMRPMWELRLAPRGGVPLPAFTTGDHVAVQPVAPEHAVDALCARLRWDPDFRFAVETSATSAPAAGGAAAAGGGSSVKLPAVLAGGRSLTVRSLLRHVLDVSGEVSPHQLRALAVGAGDPAEADALRRLCERGPFLERVRGGFATLGSLLAAFPSVHLPLDRALALLPPITPRYYSVSSAGDGGAGGGSLSGGSLDVTFRQMRAAVPPAGLGRGAAALSAAPGAATGGGNPVWFQGLASSYMASLRKGDAVSVGVRPSSFRLPDDPAAPVVFIAGGIGVAPFRAFALHRLAQVRGAGGAPPQRLGPGLMLYGCRDADDEVYARLWQACVAEGALTAVDIGHAAPLAGARAPARLADALVAAHADEVWQALSRPAGGVVYVCGGASGFGKAVAGAVRSIVAAKGGITDPAALDAAMSRLLEGCRFVEDLAD